MKKPILIFCSVVAIFSLTALGFTNWNNAVSDHNENLCRKSVVSDNHLVGSNNEKANLDLLYKISNRWSTITKEELSKAKSITDIVPGEASKTRYSYKNVTVSILHNDKDVRDIKTSEMGQSVEFNDAQIALLHSSDYSTNIRITALSRLKNDYTGIFKDDSLVYYMTIIPEKEAEFAGGPNALIDYLRENSKEKIAIKEMDQLQPGKVFFTVTKNGTIANVKLMSTSGYSSVDNELVAIIVNMPGKWDPARNLNGEKVNQEFVLFFGIVGC